MAVSEIADCLCVKIHRIWRIFNYWMLQATTDEDLSSVSQLGIDATSNKKGYKVINMLPFLWIWHNAELLMFIQAKTVIR